MNNSITVDRATATQNLAYAYHNSILPSSDFSEKIREIINGSHKTYKYIFITALLAKTTDESINPLALQAGADLEGSYDARSLAHKVLVPFERSMLHNALGGSNEPFLNKPARFKTLSLSNAVRRGSDRKTLEDLIEILSSVTNKKMAMDLLCESMYVIKERVREIEDLQDINTEHAPEITEIFQFIKEFTEKSYEGETLVVVVATLEEIFAKSWKQKVSVKAHKVNQSGASSKEVGDIDIYINGHLFYSIEVKDKDFSDSDYQHAAKKVINAGGGKLLFVFGKNADYDKQAVEEVDEELRQSIIISIVSILDYSKLMLLKIKSTETSDFLKVLMDKAVEINATDSTKLHIKEIAQKFGWIV